MKCSCCLLWCFNCLSQCGCRDRVIARYAFFPPQPPGYELKELDFTTTSSGEQEKPDGKSGSTQPSFLVNAQFWPSESRYCSVTQYKLLVKNKDGVAQEVGAIQGLELSCFVVKSSDQEIVANYVKYLKKPSDYVILFSHGNSTDIGYMLDAQLDLTYNCKINVITYDYSGYGCSAGQVTDVHVLENVVLIYNFLRHCLNYAADKIIVYGQSIGSGPSMYLAANPEFSVGALIIHSGLASGLRVIAPEMKSNKKDFFPNSDLIQYVNCPIFIIHGSQDKEVHVRNAARLANNAKQSLISFWLVENAGHNNIEHDKRFRYEYFRRLKEFITCIQQKRQSWSKHQLDALTADEWRPDFDHLYTKFTTPSTKQQLVRSMVINEGMSHQNMGPDESYCLTNSTITDATNTKVLSQSLLRKQSKGARKPSLSQN